MPQYRTTVGAEQAAMTRLARDRSSKRLKIAEGCEVEFYVSAGGRRVLPRHHREGERLEGHVETEVRSPPISIREMDQAVGDALVEDDRGFEDRRSHERPRRRRTAPNDWRRHKRACPHLRERRRTAGASAVRMIDESNPGQIFVNVVVLAEFAWTMRRAYKWDDDWIRHALTAEVCPRYPRSRSNAALASWRRSPTPTPDPSLCGSIDRCAQSRRGLRDDADV